MSEREKLAKDVFDRLEKMEKSNEEKTKAPKQDIARDLAEAFIAEDSRNGVFEHNNTTYIRYVSDERVRLVRPTTNEFKKYLSKLHFRLRNRTIDSRTIDKTVLHLSSLKAKRVELRRRVAKKDGVLYFNLSNDKGEVVRVTEDGWKVIVPYDPIFLNDDTQLPAFLPVQPTDDVKAFDEIWNHINYDRTFELLHKIAFLFSFMAVFPQPISVVHGEHGSAKSYFTKTWQRFVDPSIGDNHSMVKDKELTHILGTNWFVSFDNVSGIDGNQSDILCQASTGGTVAKRRLYTDGETFTMDLRSVVILNGINVSPNQPDLMRRCILFNFKHIKSESRRTESELQSTIDEIGEGVMGAIFSIISRAMSLVHKYEDVKDRPIMSDFDQWGRALTEALGKAPEDFVEEYKRNRILQNTRIADSDEFATILFEYLEAQIVTDGLVKIPKDRMLMEITQMVEQTQPALLRDKWFPKTTVAVTRKLERLRPTLRSLGYEFAEERRQMDGKRERVFTFSVPKCPSLEALSSLEPQE